MAEIISINGRPNTGYDNVCELFLTSRASDSDATILAELAQYPEADPTSEAANGTGDLWCVKEANGTWTINRAGV